MKNNHLFPFLWMHGEEISDIVAEIEQIHSCKINEFCVESRPHPDFMGERWFSDMRIILHEAKKRGMRVWVLDDKIFPTGYANGLIVKKYPQYLRKFMTERHIDAFGPLSGAAFHFEMSEDEGERLIAAVAVPENKNEKARVLTERVSGKKLYWDVPEGLWRVFFIIETRKGGNAKVEYLNPLIAEATKGLIEAVYEPHYKEFKEEFGKTFAGFFSDEPQFGNVGGALAKEARLGSCPMPLPYAEGLTDELNKEWGSDFTVCLPLLFQDKLLFKDGGDTYKHARYCYMNVVSKLYGENFSGVLGTWCKEHGVEYVGHVIEDDGAHARLGMGAGHFFRALSGQTYAGIDVVLRQLLPGRDAKITRTACGSVDSNGEFYHYTLAKLASSLGHLNENMRGRSFCEIFGAYGWSEGLKLMKWLTDFMLVRGINYFVPHAFSAKTFPDPDCPPHFYAQGKNPQFKYFNILTEYMERTAEILSGGKHKASVAVLYNAEAEWYGDCMPIDVPSRELMRAQIDFDIVWADILKKAEVKKGKLMLNGETFGALIVPYSEALPYEVVKWIDESALKGLEIIFVGGFLKSACEIAAPSNVQETILKNCKVVSEEKLTKELKCLGHYDVLLKEPNPWVRFYRYEKEKTEYYMFFNEHPYKFVKTEVDFCREDEPVVYDVLNDKKYIKKDNILELAPYESVIYVFGDNGKENAKLLPEYGKKTEICSVWEISKASFDEGENFTFYKKTTKLENMAKEELLPNFSGTLRYKAYFNHSGGEKAEISVGMAYETVILRLNGKSAGVKVCPPYTFEVDNLKKGENLLEIDVVNTLANYVCDPFSRTDVFEPVGLMGPVCMAEEK